MANRIEWSGRHAAVHAGTHARIGAGSAYGKRNETAHRGSLHCDAASTKQLSMAFFCS
jgi:hypothetical protein